MESKTTHSPQKFFSGIDRTAFGVSSGFLVLFVIWALIDSKSLQGAVNGGFAYAIKYFGAYWQVLLLATFIIGLYLAFTKTGEVRLGGFDKPELTRFSWTAMIMCTLLAGGGVFFAAGEPLSHFLSPPPMFPQTSDPFQKAVNALATSFMDWGFLAWAILGSLTSIVFMHLHYKKGLPLKPRTLLYPVFGESVIKGTFGSLVDALCIIAVAAGTIGPIGFLGLQVSNVLHAIFPSIPDALQTQVLVVIFAVAIYIISALSGINRGIKILSGFNVILAAVLLIYILLVGPTNFIINGYLHGVGTLMDNFFTLALFRADEAWLGWWTVFFWGWFLGYGPIMAIFIARVSKGRTIRDIILTISVAAPLITYFWFSIVGGSGLAFELVNAGSVSKALEGFNLPAALVAITTQLPLATLITILFLILTTIFIVTTGDSITYTISVAVSGDEQPDPYVRAFWGLLMGLCAIVLMTLNGVRALQNFIVITAIPVSLILLPSLWTAPQIAHKLLQKQQMMQK